MVFDTGSGNIATSSAALTGVGMMGWKKLEMHRCCQHSSALTRHVTRQKFTRWYWKQCTLWARHVKTITDFRAALLATPLVVLVSKY